MYTIEDFKQTKIVIDFRDEENPEKLLAILKAAYPKRPPPTSAYQAWFYYGDQWGWGCTSDIMDWRSLSRLPLVKARDIQLPAPAIK